MTIKPDGKRPAAMASSTADKLWQVSSNRVAMIAFVWMIGRAGKTYPKYICHTPEQTPDQYRNHKPLGAYQRAELTMRVLGK